jgi:AcrR family transcriptional regulator
LVADANTTARRSQAAQNESVSVAHHGEPTAQLDLRADYSPRAIGILEAARRVVVRDGAENLSLRAVARESNETTSLVLYHFSSMEKLEALLLDSLWHDIVREFVTGLDAMPANRNDRIDTLVEFHARIAREPGLYRTYVDLVSHVIPNDSIRENVALIYKAYRSQINQPFVALPTLDDVSIGGRAAIALAAGEGIPIDALISPDGPDQELVFALLAYLLKVASGVSSRLPQGLDNLAHAAHAKRPEFGLLPSGVTAHRLIAAGQNLIRIGGVRSVTLEACARESGEARPSVGYHFGNKQKFLDAIAATALNAWIDTIEKHLNGSGRFTSQDLAGRLFCPQSPIASLMLVLPTILRNPSLATLAKEANNYVHQQIATFLELENPWASKSHNLTLSRLYNASLFGLSLQYLYDPSGFDPRPALEFLCSAIRLGTATHPAT